MTSQERTEIQKVTRKPVGSMWGYWPFVLPVLVVIIGIAVQAVLLGYFKRHLGEFDILIRHGKQTQLLWDSDLVQQAVLTVSFSITITFALLAFLAWQSHKQAVLLKAAAKELGIETGDQGGPPTENLPARPESNQASSATLGFRP